MTTKTDVLIIGGGSIGLNSAYYLLKSGREVTIVDQKLIAAGSSAGNAGHIVPSHIVPLAAPGMIGTSLKWMLNPATSPFSMKISAVFVLGVTLVLVFFVVSPQLLPKRPFDPF